MISTYPQNISILYHPSSFATEEIQAHIYIVEQAIADVVITVTKALTEIHGCYLFWCLYGTCSLQVE